MAPIGRVDPHWRERGRLKKGMFRIYNNRRHALLGLLHIRFYYQVEYNSAEGKPYFLSGRGGVVQKKSPLNGSCLVCLLHSSEKREKRVSSGNGASTVGEADVTCERWGFRGGEKRQQVRMLGRGALQRKAGRGQLQKG